jgi:hypothetical protein
MVTAAIASRPRHSLLPLWTRRIHSWWFVGQVAANLVAAWLIIRLVEEMDWAELGLGLLLGQGFLLSVWLALGGLSNVARFVCVLVVTLAGALAVSDQSPVNPSFSSWVEQASQVFIVSFFMVMLFHGLLLPLRWLLGWRLDFDPAYHKRQAGGRLQVGVVHFLGWTTFLAIPCGILRLMPPDDIGEIVFICLSVSAMTLPVAAMLVLAVVAKRTWRWSLVAALVFVAVWGIESVLPSMVFAEHFLQFNLGIAAAVLGNLLALRLFGLKLFSVIEARVAANESGNAVKAPHFQLSPTLQASAQAAAGS